MSRHKINAHTEILVIHDGFFDLKKIRTYTTRKTLLLPIDLIKRMDFETPFNKSYTIFDISVYKKELAFGERYPDWIIVKNNDIDKAAKLKPYDSVPSDPPQIMTKSAIKWVFSGKRVVFTGKGPLLRKDLKKRANQLGAVVNNVVTYNTYVLVTDDINSNSAKMKKAKEYKIILMTYPEFLNIRT